MFIIIAGIALAQDGYTPMKLAVHYSHAAADLLARGQIAVDYFKCPAWPDLVPRARRLRPVYVHFDLVVGQGRGVVTDGAGRAVAEWGAIDRLLAQTDTPFVNVHLAPRPRDYPDLPGDSARPADGARVAEALIRDLRPLVARFGPGRVIVENEPYHPGLALRPACEPAVIRAVVEEVGCGLLLDLSHARISARALGVDPWAYLGALPLARTRELHLTGLQVFDARWDAYLRGKGADTAPLAPYLGRWLDHLPLTEADWAFTARALARVGGGAWGRPWVVALEYGGVGAIWEASTDAVVLREQLSRLHGLVRAH